jgi:hypothetical protein
MPPMAAVISLDELPQCGGERTRIRLEMERAGRASR